MTTTSQEFVGQLFLAWLFDAVRSGGKLVIYRPEGKEEVDLKTSTITYSVEKAEVVIHHGINTTPILILDNWISVQHMAEPAGARSVPLPSVLFQKADNFALEVVRY